MTDSALSGGQRAKAYWFLASLFGHRMDADALQRIASVNAGVQSEEAGIAADIHTALDSEADWGELAERLAAEHARLFLGLREGHGPPPPYESLWREGRIAGDSTLAVATAYSEAGFDDKGPWGPCDHLAYELRFIASLCYAEDESSRAGSTDEAEWARARQARFVDEHLAVWVPGYCAQLAEQAREPLYQALAKVTGRVIAEDARQLRTGYSGYGANPIPPMGVGDDRGVET
ncbi:MAG: molecular chaperone TorD family protein [Pseudomonadota bacterium]|nr:molecular chaperone TorD family protein [Pseudomonadota bacterium]